LGRPGRCAHRDVDDQGVHRLVEGLIAGIVAARIGSTSLLPRATPHDQGLY
jgi:hypothetical protein